VSYLPVKANHKSEPSLVLGLNMKFSFETTVMQDAFLRDRMSKLQALDKIKPKQGIKAVILGIIDEAMTSGNHR
jgi:hypothetical protein